MIIRIAFCRLWVGRFSMNGMAWGENDLDLFSSESLTKSTLWAEPDFPSAMGKVDLVSHLPFRKTL